MKVITLTNFRHRLRFYVNQVCSNHQPLFLKSRMGDEVVILSRSAYESMEETFYLFKSPRNAERLLLGIEEYQRDMGKERNLIQE